MSSRDSKRELFSASFPKSESDVVVRDGMMGSTVPDVQLVDGAFSCPLCRECLVSLWLRVPDRFHLRHREYELLRCSGCSLAWMKDPPEPREMAVHYGAQYHDGITSAGEEKLDERWKEHVATVRRFAQGGALLDIGCSSGAFLRAIQGDTWRLYGLEIDPEVAERARVRTGAKVISGDAPSASFTENRFDVVTCFHVLEHQHRPFELMAKVSQWLRPSGVFYVVVPNIDSWEARAFGSYWYGLEAPRHLYHFSKESLRRSGIGAGLELVELRTRSDCHVEASLIYVLNEVRRWAHRPEIFVGKGRTPSLAWRIPRKALRLIVLSAIRHLAANTGNGASISAVFRKP